MTWTAFWNSIADLFMFCFKIIKSLANMPNAIVWVVIISLLGYWTLQLRKQIKEAKQAGTRP
jgi:hypothetical protein